MIRNSTSKKQRLWYPVPSLHGKQIGKQWKQWETLLFWSPKSLQMLTAATKLRHLLLGRKAMINLDTIFKSRDITLLAKVRVVKVMVFPVVMYGCESWTVKNAEHWETDAFGLWCWRRLLRVPWISGSSNLSILEEIILNIVWKDCCWSWSSNTLATWYEELTHWKRLMLGKIEGRRKRGWQRMRWSDRITDSMDINLSKLWEIVEDRGACSP